MAKRPRQHQLEDESITALRAARPSLWPIRRKGEDYGIDFEVEIFDSDENSTGLIFFVQLKATDDQEGRKIVLGREYLEGICQYDTPTIIARYYARDKRLFWDWAGDLWAQIPNDQATKTFNFTDDQLLDDAAFREIENALVVGRQLENTPANAPLEIRLCVAGVLGRRPLELRRALEQIEAAETPGICFYQADAPELREGVVLEIGANEIRLSLGPRYTTLVEIDNEMPAEIAAGRTLYAIATLLDICGLSSHATLHAKNLLQLGIRTDIRPQAAQVAKTLVNDPDSYIDFALMNDLHALQDMPYLSVLFGIYQKPGAAAGLSQHGLRFLEAALQHAVNEGPQAEGTVLYSMANAARQIDLRFAVSLYLRAKRKKPEYKTIDYFLRELAGCFFLLGRFRSASRLYQKSGIDIRSPLDALLYGDACLFSHQTDDAISCFQTVLTSPDELVRAEGELKLWLAKKLKNEHNAAFGVSGLADRFNSGVTLAHNGSHEDALSKFLPCCLIVPSDHESWINSAICCHNLGIPELYVNLLLVGFSLEGEALLESLIAEFDSRGASDQMYDLLSGAFATVKSLNPSNRKRAPAQKIHNFDAAISVCDPQD